MHKERYQRKKCQYINLVSNIDFYEQNENRRYYKHGHNKWYIPIYHNATVPVVKQRWANNLIVKSIVRTKIKVWKWRFYDQSPDNWKYRQYEIRQIHVLEFFFQKFTVNKFGIENMVKKKSGNENEKRCPSRDQVGQHPLTKTVDHPTGDAVAMADYNQDNGDSPKILKRSQVHTFLLRVED